MTHILIFIEVKDFISFIHIFFSNYVSTCICLKYLENSCLLNILSVLWKNVMLWAKRSSLLFLYNEGTTPALASPGGFSGDWLSRSHTNLCIYPGSVIFNCYCQSTPFHIALCLLPFWEVKKVSDQQMTYLHFMSVLHIRLACSLEMMMHITLIKIRKFTWRDERRIYVIIKKYICISIQKVGLCIHL